MLIQFTTKALFRFVHIMCGCIFIGNTITDLFWPHYITSGYLALNIICVIFLLISGIVNIILTQPSKIFHNEDRRLWSTLIYSKIVLWLFLLHIPELIFSSLGYSYSRQKFNAFLVILIVFISVITKNFRDMYQKTPSTISKYWTTSY